MYVHATICTQSQKTEGGTKSAVDLTPHHQKNLVWQLFFYLDCQRLHKYYTV